MSDKVPDNTPNNLPDDLPDETPEIFRYTVDNWSAEPADKINNYLKKLSDTLDLGKLKQGEILSYMRESKRFVELTNPETGKPYSKWAEWCKGELGLEIRTAQYRVNVYNKLIKKLEIPVEKIEEIGWAKASIFASKADPVSAKFWVQQATDKSSRELREMIRDMKNPKAYDEGGEEKKPLDKVILQFTDEDKEVFESAIDSASRSCNHRNRSRLIAHICLQFLSDDIFGQGSMDKAAQLEWYIQRIEETYGIKLKVIEE